jgi:hypothetical protein
MRSLTLPINIKPEASLALTTMPRMVRQSEDVRMPRTVWRLVSAHLAGLRLSAPKTLSRVGSGTLETSKPRDVVVGVHGGFAADRHR